MYTAGDGHQDDREFRAPGMEYTPPGYEFTPVGLKGPESEEKDSRRWLLKHVVAVAALGIVWTALLAGRQTSPAEPSPTPSATPTATPHSGPHARQDGGAGADGDSCAHTGTHAGPHGGAGL